MIPLHFVFAAVLLLLSLLPVSCRESVSSSVPADIPSDLVTVEVCLDVDSALAVSESLRVHFVASDLSGASYVVIFESVGQNRYRATLPSYVAQDGGQLVVSLSGESYSCPLNSQTWQSGEVYLYSFTLTSEGLSFRMPVVPDISDGWEHHHQTDVVLG